MHPRTHSIHWAHLRREVGDVDPLRLLEQPHRGAYVALRGTNLGQLDPPPVRVLWQAGRLAEFLGSVQLLGRTGEVTSRPGHPAQLHVQVGRAAHRRLGRNQREAIAAAALGVAQPATGQVDVDERDDAAEYVRDMADAEQVRCGDPV